MVYSGIRKPQYGFHSIKRGTCDQASSFTLIPGLRSRGTLNASRMLPKGLSTGDCFVKT